MAANSSIGNLWKFLVQKVLRLKIDKKGNVGLPLVGAAKSLKLNVEIEQASYCLKMVKPHIPLIKFRKRGTHYGQESRPYALEIIAPTTSAKSAIGTLIDDLNLPSKYARKPMSQQEMEFIEVIEPVAITAPYKY